MRGRLSDSDMTNVVNDDPSMLSMGTLTKQDILIERLNAVLTAIDAASDATTLFNNLNAINLQPIDKLNVK
jgi:hypothetical protein